MQHKQTSREWLTVQLLEDHESIFSITNTHRSFFLLFFFKPGIVTIKLPGTDILPVPDEDSTFGYCLLLHKPLQEAIAYDPALIYHPHFNGLFLPKAVPMKLTYQLLINNLFERMREEQTRDDLFKDEMLQGYFKILLLTILKQLEENSIPEEQHDNHLAKKFQDLLEKNFRSKKFVSEYADALYVGPAYLNTVVKKATGHSASYHIKQRIALEAKRKAAYTNMCMKEIAFDLGFADVPHFSKYFKAATGINFSAFIQKNIRSCLTS